MAFSSLFSCLLSQSVFVRRVQQVWLSLRVFTDCLRWVRPKTLMHFKLSWGSIPTEPLLPHSRGSTSLQQGLYSLTAGALPLSQQGLYLLTLPAGPCLPVFPVFPALPFFPSRPGRPLAPAGPCGPAGQTKHCPRAKIFTQNWVSVTDIVYRGRCKPPLEQPPHNTAKTSALTHWVEGGHLTTSPKPHFSQIFVTSCF